MFLVDQIILFAGVLLLIGIDPMAIFLTIGALQLLQGEADSVWGLLRLFVLQMGVGAAVGLGMGWLAIRLMNRINLTAMGLSRGKALVAPRGSTRLETGDHLFVIAPQHCKVQVDEALKR